MADTTTKLTLLASATDGWNQVNSSVYSTDSPTSLTSLDLSANVGGYSAVRLMITNNEGADSSTVVFYPGTVTPSVPTAAANHGGAHMASLPAGGRGYVDTVTDGDGCAQWIDLEGARSVTVTLIGYTEEDNTAPVITSGSPTAADAESDITISFSTTDVDDNADEDTIDLEVTDSDGTYDAIIDGVFQTPDWDGTISANADGGHDVTVSTHPDLASGSCSATAYVEDTGGLSDTDTWSWTTVVAPVIASGSPTSSTTAPNADISFSTSDDDGDAQSDTIDLEVTDTDGTYDAIIDGVFQTGWSGTITANGSGGHDVVVTTHPPFAVGPSSATASAEDSGGRSGAVTWEWVTIMPSAPSYLRMLEFVLPPWLLRTEGMRLVGALAAIIDDHRDRLVAGVKLRFPGLYTLEGVDRIGRERRLRRGPAEDAETFAERLPRWWQDHRTRGGAYALLEQMLVYLDGTLDPPYDVVSYRGVRHVMDTDGDITRDTITWGTDETGYWARVWVVVYTTATSVDAETLESYAAIVRDWLPAHVVGTLVVIHPGTRLWGYPKPVARWGDGSKWGGPIGGGVTSTEL